MMLVNTRAGRTKRRDGRETVMKYHVVLLFVHMGVEIRELWGLE